MTVTQRDLVLSAFPSGTRIVSAAPARAEWLPCPVRVVVEIPDGSTETVYARAERYRGGVEREAQLLPALGRLGLPVPALLAGPVADSALPGMGMTSVITAVPGASLDDRLWGVGHAQIGAVVELLAAAIDRLHGMTEALRSDPAAVDLPRQTLADELRGVGERAGPWLQHRAFAGALERLLPVAQAVGTPLVFSNGDYNPGNFLAAGEVLTGFIDFARARFEDPLAGLAKFWIYDFVPLQRARFVERFLAERGATHQRFLLRLAIRSLFTLQREMPEGYPAAGARGRAYADRLLGMVQQGVEAGHP